MKTYIRNTIKGYYIDFPEEIDSEYWAGKIGSTYEDFQNDKWILLSEAQVEFRNNNPWASIQEVLNMYIEEPTEPERTLEQAKSEKLAELAMYDSSDTINSFDVIINGNTISTWLNPIERSNYKSSIDAAKIMGENYISLYIENNNIQLTIGQADVFLAKIQLYANNCYMVTKQHQLAIEQLDSILDVDNYNYTQGYPEKIVFNLDE